MYKRKKSVDDYIFLLPTENDVEILEKIIQKVKSQKYWTRRNI